MNNRNAYDGEAKLTEEIFNLLGKNKGYVIDYADNGRELYLTNGTNGCFTISVTQDE